MKKYWYSLQYCGKKEYAQNDNGLWRQCGGHVTIIDLMDLTKCHRIMKDHKRNAIGFVLSVYYSQLCPRTLAPEQNPTNDTRIQGAKSNEMRNIMNMLRDLGLGPRELKQNGSYSSVIL